MNKKNYIDKIELILNTSGKYIKRKEKDMILDYVNYFKTKKNVIEDKNIELVIEIERLKELCDKYEEEHKTLFKEWKKTINIINELERDLKGKIDEDRLNILSNSHWKYVLDKLQELKGEKE